MTNASPSWLRRMHFHADGVEARLAGYPRSANPCIRARRDASGFPIPEARDNGAEREAWDEGWRDAFLPPLVSPADADLIAAVVRRVGEACPEIYGGAGRFALTLDLTTVHAGDCPLDLEKLLAAPRDTLAHDIGGIRAHIDRDTGHLEGTFLLRCARPRTSAE